MENKIEGVVEIGGKFFVSRSDKEGKATFVQMTDSEQREYLSQQVEKELLADAVIPKFEILADVQRAVNEARDEVHSSMKKNIIGVVLQSLGFSNDHWGGGWRVDHCNGRMSKISDLISGEVRANMLALNLADYTLSEKERSDICADIRKDIKDQFKRVLAEEARRKVSEDVKRGVDAYIQQMVGIACKDISETVLKQMIKVNGLK